ncbi:MAG: heme o synthase [Bacteroidetes bacterium]|nr:heme o synthase [Bacteroidota bacterium]
MISEKVISVSPAFSLKLRLKDYVQFIKLRLNLLVIFSTALGFLIANPHNINWFNLLVVSLGGFLTVGAANGINQIIERDSDRLMLRTENRPLAQNRMSMLEATIAALIMGIIGVGMIAHYLVGMCAILSLVSLCLYGFVYTPLKKVTPLAVHIGAIPGALPAVIGYVAANGSLDGMAWILFFIQVLWQFPHFYSIAWILDDDYKRAGIKLMPLFAMKDKRGAIQIMLFTSLLIPMSVLAFILGFTGLIATIVLVALSGYFFYQSLQLLKDLTNASAKKLMFGSFLYLPVAFIIILIDKIF